ncbi:SpaA isopeptide-forming pilin-related protein [uncultured Vagococcus sp.]|uniref:SpaA isopeptide-forming pilin-related protein n=1 Tax=uncultured Vagococcus sp. TaxID=189676 RepID=UPI0025866FD6|nr:SpaA isopeptide-forming pilin-related protein [uncultured Vagococcus sp.]
MSKKNQKILPIFLLIIFIGLLMVFPKVVSAITTFDNKEQEPQSSDSGNSIGRFSFENEKESYFIYEPVNSRFFITMNQVSVTDAIIEIRIPSKYLDSVPRGSDFNLTSKAPVTTLDEETQEYVITYEIPQISGGYEGSIPFNYTTKIHLTPDNYDMKVVGRVLNSKKEELARAEDHVFFQTKNPTPSKMVRLNGGGFVTTSNTAIVIGEEDPENPGFTYGIDNIDKLIPVEYKFKYTQSRTTVGTRMYGFWQIIDKLPEGAYFREEDNPDWTYNKDTNEATYFGKTAAKYDSSETTETPALTVYYPNHALPKTGETLSYTNESDVTFFPFEGEEDEKKTLLNPLIKHQMIALERATQPISISKTGSLVYDTLSHKEKGVEWSINFNNPINTQSESMENVVIRDFDLDERLEYTSILAHSSYYGIEGSISFIGVKEDGTEVILDDNYILEASEYKAKVVPIKKGIKEILMKTNPGTKLLASTGSSTNRIYLTLKTDFKDPENTHLKDPEKEEKLLNYIDASGVYENDGASWTLKTPVSGQAKFLPLLTSFDINKTRNRGGNDPLYVNDTFEYYLEIGLRQAIEGQKVENPVILDLLPIGFDYVSGSASIGVASSGKNYFSYEKEISEIPREPEIIPDYHQTGRTALIWQLPTITYTYDSVTNSSMNAYRVIYKTQATSLAHDGVNTNDAYVAWDNMDEVKAFKTNATPDIFDLNNNGNREELISRKAYNVNFRAATELISTKEALGSADNGYVYYPRAAHGELGTNASYRLRALNNALNDFEHFQVLDVLPYVGDKTVSKNSEGVPYDRKSEYPVSLTGPIKVDNKYTAYYSLEEAGKEDYAEFYKTAKWEKNVEDYSKVKAIKIVMNDSEKLVRKEMFEAEVPVFIDKNYDYKDESVSNNSFGVLTDDPSDPNKTSNYFESNNAPIEIIKYHVSGTVFQDRSLTGMIDDKSVGFADYLVTLIDEDGNVAKDLEGKPITAKTDSKGYYEMELFRHGNYRIKVETPNGYNLVEPKEGDKYSHILIDNEDGLSDLFELNSRHKQLIRNAGYYRDEKPINIFKYDVSTLVDSNGNGKIDDEDRKNASPLSGAEFVVYEGHGIDKDNQILGEDGKPLVLVTKEDGTISFGGKLEADYTLVETKAPTGFELLKEPIFLTNVATSEEDELWVYVGNYSQTVLPYAGGNSSLNLLIIVFSGLSLTGLLAAFYQYYPKKQHKRKRRKTS